MRQAIKSLLPRPLLQLARKMFVLARVPWVVVSELLRKVVISPNQMIVPMDSNPSDLHNLILRLAPLNPGVPLVRLGPSNDGGYLIPDDTIGIAAVFSPGVGSESGFERDCSNRGLRVYCADGTLNSPPVLPSDWSFIAKNIGATDAPNGMKLDSWVKESDVSPTADLLLQMDIEGSEYEALAILPDEFLARFRIIVIEVHNINRWRHRNHLTLAQVMFEKLLRHHFCVHIHPNNCCRVLEHYGIELPEVLEFSFYRKDCFKDSDGHRLDFPHPLDGPNNVKKPDLVLPKGWIAHSSESC